MVIVVTGEIVAASITVITNIMIVAMTKAGITVSIMGIKKLFINTIINSRVEWFTILTPSQDIMKATTTQAIVAYI